MCGIVGYVGSKTAGELLVNGLRRLEYRGYDSAGIATLNGGGINLRRAVGKVNELAKQVASDPVLGSIGIAHTRWATHGRPSERNAHPHLDARGRIALVHNGVIENHSTLREFLEQQGIEFTSETDTEALVQLIGFFYSQTGDLLESVRSALREVKGTFGLAILCSDAPHTLIAARRGSPLIVGVGSDEFFISSDASALVAHTNQVTYLNDNEIVSLGPDGLQATTIDATPVEKVIDRLEITLDQIELAGYEHHMLKEIFEQPESLRNCMRGRLHRPRGDLTLGGLTCCERDLPRCRRILLFGCGTAWHASLIGEYLFEDLARIPCEVEYASELRYRNPIVEEGTLAIAVSQSGETADTLAALQEVRKKGAQVLGVVNVVGSTIARETDAGVYLHVGPEIGVASTKAFTAQVAVLTMMALFLGRRRHLSPERMGEVLDELERVPEKVSRALELNEQVRQLAVRLGDYDNWLYLGRGVNYPVALEGALKLKEISYIHAEGLPAAEMKHGPIAMIDPGMPVVVIAPQDSTYDKVLANIEEVRSRDGRIIAVATEGDGQMERLADEVLYVPRTLPILSPLVTSIPLQLLAYHTAIVRERDVDKPRNLAKSVTVE
jgi:glucosamine--fructose-6-phosphate aminotransferase (isomerizing)